MNCQFIKHLKKIIDYMKNESEQFYCNQDDGEYNNNPCSEQCEFCKNVEKLQKN